jgi:hypothetical protein
MRSAHAPGTRHWLRTTSLAASSNYAGYPAGRCHIPPSTRCRHAPRVCSSGGWCWEHLPGAATFARCAHSVLPPAQSAATRWVAKRPLRGLARRGQRFCMMQAAEAAGTRHWLAADNSEHVNPRRETEPQHFASATPADRSSSRCGLPAVAARSSGGRAAGSLSQTARWCSCMMRSAHAPGTRHWLRTTSVAASSNYAGYPAGRCDIPPSTRSRHAPRVCSSGG